MEKKKEKGGRNKIEARAYGRPQRNRERTTQRHRPIITDLFVLFFRFFSFLFGGFFTRNFAFSSTVEIIG
jgi:hypothetical protein